MIGEDERSPVAKPLQLFVLTLDRSLQFNINEVTSSCGGFSKQFQLRGYRPSEFAPAYHSAAGSNRHNMRVIFSEALDFGQSQAWSRKVV